jgi:hypothetical protein
MSELDTLKTAVVTDLTAGEALIAPVVTDIKALIANRIGDALIAAIVLVSIWVGHAI